jgi:hypothetical protein
LLTHIQLEKITAAIKNTIDFGWIWSSVCSLQHQEIMGGIVRSVTRLAIPWLCKRRNRSLMETSRQRLQKEVGNPVSQVSQYEYNASLFFIFKKFIIY